MKKNRLLLLIAMFLLVLAACSNGKSDKSTESSKEDLENINETGFPIVNETIKLDFFGGTGPFTKVNWAEVPIWKKYAEDTNIDVKWEVVSSESLAEKRNLKIAGGDLPDAFYASWLGTQDVMKYGQSGIFIPLNDLIDEHAPHLKAIFEDMPEVKRALTFPDGNIYSMPTIQGFDSMRFGGKPWINEDFLKALDMEIPETTEEFYNYLKAVKKGDPNGNGQADEIPYGARNMDELISWIRGSFGLGQGVKAGNVDLDPNTGDIRFYPLTEEYREMLDYVHKLFDEGLIEKNIFSIEPDQYLANGSASLYGSSNTHSPIVAFGEEQGSSYVGLSALKGPNGDQQYTNANHPVAEIGGFVITSENEHPVATIKWMDFFYSDEGSKLLYMGIEGESFEETENGDLEFVEEITNNPDGLTFDQAVAKYVTYPGGHHAGIVKQEYFKGSEATQQELDATEGLKEYAIDEVWPEFTYTKEENDRRNTVGQDIDKYAGEMRDKFISGDESLDDKNWENYVNTINKMGLDEYMEILDAAYERYSSN